MLLCRLLVVVLSLLAAASSYHLCNCKYHPGGCAIAVAAPRGFKCKCLYKGAWTCSGVALPCRDDEACPGGRYSYCACIQGGGSCGAYYLRSNTKERCSEVNKDEASSSLEKFSFDDCECNYYKGGCLIVKPAPKRFKCVCSYKGFWTCTGWSQGCDEDEYCPAGDYTYCGCRRGMGRCGAYPASDKKKECDFNRPPAMTCNCHRSSDWTLGQYSIDDVTFKIREVSRSNPKPAQIGTSLDVPNASDGAQSLALTVVETMTSESVFERTTGIAIAIGTQFMVSLPFAELTGSTTLTSEQSFKFGEKTTTSSQFRHVFTCTSQPKTLTRCKIYVTTFDVTVPYTMYLTHNEIPNCVCPSHGFWKGTAAFNSRLTAEGMRECNRINSEGICAM